MNDLLPSEPGGGGPPNAGAAGRFDDPLAGVRLDDLAAAVSDAGPVVVPSLDGPLRIGFVCTDPVAGSPSALVFDLEPGRPVSCAAAPPSADLSTCHLRLHADRGAVVGAVACVPHDPPLVTRFTVDDEGCGGTWRGPLPPLDLAGIAALSSLPAIEGASVVAQLLLTGSPVGGIPYWMSIVDGRLQVIAPGVTEAPDVYISFGYEGYLRVRAGDMFVSDAIVGGDLAGDFAKLQMFSGLVQSLPFQDAYRAGFRSLRRLADYAKVVALEEHRAMAAAVRRTLDIHCPHDASPARADAGDRQELPGEGGQVLVRDGRTGRDGSQRGHQDGRQASLRRGLQRGHRDGTR